MLAVLTLAATATTVVVGTADSYSVPLTERTVLEARCHGRALKLIEQQGRMTLVVDDQAIDITAVRFGSNYVTGSDQGRFTIACRRADRGFSINFFGVHIAQDGASVTSAGSPTYGDSLSVLGDAAIRPRQDINLRQFNMKRNQYRRQ